MKKYPSIEAEKFFKILRTRPSVFGQSYYILAAADFRGNGLYHGRTLVLSPTGGIESPLTDYRFEHNNDEDIALAFGEEAFFETMLENAKGQLFGHFWELIERGIATRKTNESSDLLEEQIDIRAALSTIILGENSSFKPLIEEFAKSLLDSETQILIAALTKASKHYIVSNKPWTLG